VAAFGTSRVDDLRLQSISAALRHPTKGLVSHMDFLVNSRKNLFYRLQNLQRRSQTQLAFVCVQNNILEHNFCFIMAWLTFCLQGI
jgi:hypothetical protein